MIDQVESTMHRWEMMRTFQDFLLAVYQEPVAADSIRLPQRACGPIPSYQEC